MRPHLLSWLCTASACSLVGNGADTRTRPGPCPAAFTAMAWIRALQASSACVASKQMRSTSNPASCLSEGEAPMASSSAADAGRGAGASSACEAGYRRCVWLGAGTGRCDGERGVRAREGWRTCPHHLPPFNALLGPASTRLFPSRPATRALIRGGQGNGWTRDVRKGRGRRKCEAQSRGTAPACTRRLTPCRRCLRALHGSRRHERGSAARVARAARRAHGAPSAAGRPRLPGAARHNTARRLHEGAACS